MGMGTGEQGWMGPWLLLSCPQLGQHGQRGQNHTWALWDDFLAFMGRLGV